MSIHQKHHGIADDTKFINYYYYYHHFKDYVNNNEETSSEEKNKAKYLSCINYLSAIQRSIETISAEKDVKKDYLDFIRWNKIIINEELNEYEDDAYLVSTVVDLKEKVSSIKNSLSSIERIFFELDELEKGICHEYQQAYEISTRTTDGLTSRMKTIIHEHAGRLFINYINILNNKFYTEKLDRENITFDDIVTEADFLKSTLENIDGRIAMDIETTITAFKDFRELDYDCRLIQDDAIADAEKLAHQRATESVLQQTIRIIRTTIADIEETLTKGLENVFEKSFNAGRSVTEAVLHPIKTAKSLWFCVSHPVTSAKAIWHWAKKNPLKCMLLSVFGISLLLSGVVGIVGVAGITTTVIGCGIIAGTSVMIARTAGDAGVLKATADDKIEKHKNVEKALVAKNDEESERISSQARDAEYLREKMKEAKLQAEREMKLIREIQQSQKVVNQRKLKEISNKELNSLNSQFKNIHDETVENLKTCKEDYAKLKDKFKQTQQDNHQIRMGREAAKRISQRSAEANSVNKKCSKNEF